MSVIEASRKEALLQPCRLLLLGGFFNTSTGAINKNVDISL